MKRSLLIVGAITFLLVISGCGLIPGQATNSDLDGTSWKLESYGGKTLIGETAMTAKFLVGEISGSTSCNQYFGAYEAKGDQLTIKDLGWTEMACMDPEGIMEQESDIMSLLVEIVTYTIEGETLTLRTAGGEELIFSPRVQDN